MPVGPRSSVMVGGVESVPEESGSRQMGAGLVVDGLTSALADLLK